MSEMGANAYIVVNFSCLQCLNGLVRLLGQKMNTKYDPPYLPSVPLPRRSRFHFYLDDLLGLVTTIAVALGLHRWSPYVGDGWELYVVGWASVVAAVIGLFQRDVIRYAATTFVILLVLCGVWLWGRACCRAWDHEQRIEQHIRDGQSWIDERPKKDR
jgi:hypothetical protein